MDCVVFWQWQLVTSFAAKPFHFHSAQATVNECKNRSATLLPGVPFVKCSAFLLYDFWFLVLCLHRKWDFWDLQSLLTYLRLLYFYANLSSVHSNAFCLLSFVGKGNSGVFEAGIVCLCCWPVELSRVHIPMKAGVEGSDYINASFFQVSVQFLLS